jgi:tetratricopeptide (TPR) repeat protein
MSAGKVETLGMAHAAQREYAEAEECFRDALEAHRGIGLRWRESVTLAQLGRVQRDTGQSNDALASWQQALVLLDEVGTGLSRAELVDVIESVSGEASAWRTQLGWARVGVGLLAVPVVSGHVLACLRPSHP